MRKIRRRMTSLHAYISTAHAFTIIPPSDCLTSAESERCHRVIPPSDCLTNVYEDDGKKMDEENVKSSLRAINAHYQLQCDQRIDLRHLSELVGANGKLHQGRPTMLSCRMMTKRVQFFPNGTIQILGGGVTPFLLYHLFLKVYYLLRQCDSTIQPTNLTRWKINNVVFHFDFGRRFKFGQMLCNKDFSYEAELFPAALISKWQPAHVTLFPNGKGMITGVKSKQTALDILLQVSNFLTHNVDIH